LTLQVERILGPVSVHSRIYRLPSIAGNDTWKAKNSNKEVECEEYEEKDRKEVLTPSCSLTYNKDKPSNLASRGVK